MSSLATASFVVYRRYLAALGSVIAGLSLALAAYASHAAVPPQQLPMLQAAGMAFAHGLALTALAPLAQRPLGLVSLVMLLLGLLLFSGSLLAKAVLGLSPSLAPFGGALLISGWLLHAFDRLRP
jgi:uncharacterized membrane protein YgdD (TMEM256/DUF423 family)